LRLKIIAGLFLILPLVNYAQSEKSLLPFSNALLYNPSYAGLNENNNLWSGYQFYAFSRQEMYNEFTLTYDKYSPELEGGLGFYFRQGLIGDVNINTTELGMSVSKHFKINKGYFIPSVNLNVQFATKQWYVEMVDRMLNVEFTPPSPPGYDFPRYLKIKPRVGFLYDSPFFQAGFSALFPFGRFITDEESTQNLNEPVFVMHVSQLSGGRKKGLVSKPYKLRPQLLLLHSNDIFMSRAELNFEEVYNTYSIFIQNDFTQNLHGIGGTYGWKINNFRLNIAAGMSVPVISDNVTFFGEATFGLIIPAVFYNEKNPWVPKKKLF